MRGVKFTLKMEMTYFSAKWETVGSEKIEYFIGAINKPYSSCTIMSFFFQLVEEDKCVSETVFVEKFQYIFVGRCLARFVDSSISKYEYENFGTPPTRLFTGSKTHKAHTSYRISGNL